jgi:acyl-CoA thioester hydrolase
MVHELTLRVYYEDTDAGDVVFYANYLKFIERGRTEWLRDHGFENTSIKDEYGIIFVVRHVEADYLQSAALDDVLTVRTELTDLKNASFVMNQSIYCDDALIFKAKVVIVSVNQDKKPVKLPETLKDKLIRVV